jgi:hypothetical protein
MGTVLELRLTGSGDWTAQERDQLRELIDRLPPDPDREVVFGLTDAGDPWCAVVDGDDEVVVHVARINGRFVVHVAQENLVFEAPNLWTAAARFGVGLTEPRSANVVSLNGEALPAHVLAILAIAQPALSQTLAEAPAPRPLDAPAQVSSLQSPAIIAFAPLESTIAAAHAPVAEPASAPAMVSVQNLHAPEPEVAAVVAVEETPRAFAPAAATAEAPYVILAAVAGPVAQADDSGGETLVGTAGADTLLGGHGDDSLDGRGAEDGQVDLLDGGAGDDRVVLGERVVAVGGSGDDTFIIGARPTPGGGESLGVVMDFFQSREDRLEFGPGAHVRVVTVSTEVDVLAALRNRGVGAEAPVVGGARVGLDFDGDGVADGFVLLGNARFGPGSEAPPNGTAREVRLPQFLENAEFRSDFAAPTPRLVDGAVYGFSGSGFTAYQIDPSQFDGRPEPFPHFPAAPPALGPEGATFLEPLPWV